MSHRSKRKVLVTGGSSGIGAAIAQVFSSNGDLVVATGATKEEVERAQVQSESTAISFQELDVRDGSWSEQNESLHRHAGYRRFGSLH